MKKWIKAALLALFRAGGFRSTTIGSPRGFVETTREWTRSSAGAGSTYLDVAPGERITRVLPRTVEPEVHWKFEESRDVELQPTFVATIPNGRVWGWDGVVITPDDRVLLDVSVTFKRNPRDHQALWLLKYPPLVRVAASVAVLSSVAVDNYYHWLFDTLPRLALVERSGLEPDRFCIRCEKPFQKESLALLGLPQSRIIPSDGDLHVEAERLIVPSYPGKSGEIPAWACAFLREKFLPGTATAGLSRKFYVSRSQSSYRRVTNEAEVIAELTAKGFAIVQCEALSFAEQVALFAGADTIIAPHGAALSNLVFCRRGATVIEIFSPDYVNPLFWGLANHAGLDYAYLLGDGATPEKGADPHEVGRDIHVNIEKLRTMLAV